MPAGVSAAARAPPARPRYELGLQQKEDVLHRLVDVWATGEASASLGFAAARLFDELDPLERKKDEIFAAQNLAGRAAFKALAKTQQEALELLQLSAKPAGSRDEKRLEGPESRPAGAIRAARLAGQRALPRLQALEHRPRRQHDARGRQPHGRLRRHGGLPGLPGPEVDGRPARSHLRRPGSRAASPALAHHDQRAVSRAIQAVDRRDGAASRPSAPARAPAPWRPP